MYRNLTGQNEDFIAFDFVARSFSINILIGYISIALLIFLWLPIKIYENIIFKLQVIKRKGGIKRLYMKILYYKMNKIIGKEIECITKSHTGEDLKKTHICKDIKIDNGEIKIIYDNMQYTYIYSLDAASSLLKYGETTYTEFGRDFTIRIAKS